MYLSLSDILAPTLKAVIESLETLEETEGRKVKITGGVFLLNEETCELFLASSYGISPKAPGVSGKCGIRRLHLRPGSTVRTGQYCPLLPR